MIEPHTLVDNRVKVFVFNALFPAMQRVANLVWCEDPEKKQALLEQESAEFRRVLNEHDLMEY